VRKRGGVEECGRAELRPLKVLSRNAIQKPRTGKLFKIISVEN
jgi:hypothetical protein